MIYEFVICLKQFISKGFFESTSLYQDQFDVYVTFLSVTESSSLLFPTFLDTNNKNPSFSRSNSTNGVYGTFLRLSQFFLD